jgi:YfiH family protein
MRTGEDHTVVRANRALLGQKFTLPSTPCWLRQVHGNRVVTFDAGNGGDGDEQQADAAITRTSGTVLAILTADCLPILFSADDGSEIAAVHAGWRGLAAGVIEACVQEISTPRARLLAWLGPAIGPHSYEVGEEVRGAFVDADAAAVPAFVSTRPGHWLCDLYTLARQRLAALGVVRVYGGDFDTFADPRFYSYRRDGITGRFASLIWRMS